MESILGQLLTQQNELTQQFIFLTQKENLLLHIIMTVMALFPWFQIL